MKLYSRTLLDRFLRSKYRIIYTQEKEERSEISENSAGNLPKCHILTRLGRNHPRGTVCMLHLCLRYDTTPRSIVIFLGEAECQPGPAMFHLGFIVCIAHRDYPDTIDFLMVMSPVTSGGQMATLISKYYVYIGRAPAETLL